MIFIVYILQNEKTSRFYIGYTSDLPKRLTYHNSIRNKSTKHGIPWKIVYKEKFEDKESAWLREQQIKSYKGGRAFKALLES